MNYLVVKIGVDTAENELSKVCRSKQAMPPPFKSGSVEGSSEALIQGFSSSRLKRVLDELDS